MTIQPSKKSPLVVGIEHRTDLRPFTEEEVRFEIDMCIGCDRCMRACPVPMSLARSISPTSIAPRSPMMIAPHVARFTDECVMCGSCVPVCPVDNHRDLLMLSLKQRLGISWDGKVDMNRSSTTCRPAGMYQLLTQPLARTANVQRCSACAGQLPAALRRHLKMLTLCPERTSCTRENLAAISISSWKGASNSLPQSSEMATNLPVADLAARRIYGRAGDAHRAAAQCDRPRADRSRCAGSAGAGHAAPDGDCASRAHLL